MKLNKEARNPGKKGTVLGINSWGYAFVGNGR
jgi:hypothetical protein